MYAFHKLTLILAATTLCSCVVEESWYGSYPDKGETVTFDVMATIADHIEMVRLGFAALVYDGATDDEKIIYENTIFERLLFRRLEHQWAVNDGYANYYIKIEKDSEGELRELTVTRPGAEGEGLPILDTCKVVFKGGSDWEVTIPNSSLEEYNEVRLCEAILSLRVVWMDILPTSIEAEGSGRYTSYLKHGSGGEAIDISWQLQNGITSDPRKYGYTELRKATLEIEAGPAGTPPDHIHAVIDRDRCKNEITVTER